ncbi:MAG: rhodanese-like domain-containing protein [Rhodoblastus sp.]
MNTAPARRGFKQLLAEANAVIETIDVQHALRLVGDPGVQLVDIREAHEVAQSGMAQGAVHAPRGFLEFLADPESPMHMKELAGRKLVLYCASGGRSTLAAKTLRDMGLDVCHVAGGMSAWAAAGGPIQK